MRTAPPSSDWSPPAGSSFSDSVRGLLSSVMVYLETRCSLLKVELGQALRNGIWAAILAVFATTCFFVMYVSGMVAFTLWIADRWWEAQVLPAALTVAGAHALLGMLSVAMMLWAVKSRKMFQETRRELEEDKRWLNLQTAKSKN